MSLKKQYLKSGETCKITFRLTKNEVENAENVAILGCFTEWEQNAIPMKKLKSGEFTAAVSLPTNQNFEYRYLVNGEKWINEAMADGYVPNGLGTDNCVISTVQ